jgi:hypothetical protein
VGRHDGQRQRIGNGDNQRALGFCIGNNTGEVAINAFGIRPRHDDCSGVVIDRAASFNQPAERLGARIDDIDGLRMQIASQKHAAALVAMMTAGNAHRFGNSGCFIEQRSASNRPTGQLGNQRLEVEQ